MLSEDLYEDDLTKLKIQAALAGVDIEKETKKKKEENIFLFKAPEEYANYTEEEKKELTKKMMGKHKQWAEGKMKEMKIDEV